MPPARKEPMIEIDGVLWPVDGAGIALIEYSKDGDPVSDFELNETCLGIIKTGGNFSFSTENIVHSVRYLVASGLFKEDDFAFLFEGKIIHMNKYGAIDPWPNGFADCTGQLNADILGAAMNKKRWERDNL